MEEWLSLENLRQREGVGSGSGGVETQKEERSLRGEVREERTGEEKGRETWEGLERRGVPGRTGTVLRVERPGKTGRSWNRSLRRNGHDPVNTGMLRGDGKDPESGGRRGEVARGERRASREGEDLGPRNSEDGAAEVDRLI